MELIVFAIIKVGAGVIVIHLLGLGLHASRVLGQIADALEGVEVLVAAANLQGATIATDVVVVAARQGGQHEAVGLVAAHKASVQLHIQCIGGRCHLHGFLQRLRQQ